MFAPGKNQLSPTKHTAFYILGMTTESLSKGKVTATIAMTLTLSVFYLSAVDWHQLPFVIAVAFLVLLIDGYWLNRLLNGFVNGYASSNKIGKDLDAYLKQSLRFKALYWLLKDEFNVIFYALFAKHFKAPVANHRLFSYAKSSNAKDMFWVVLVAQLPTLPFVHFMMDNIGHPLAAWLVTLLTLWSVVYYYAQIEAIKHLPIEMTDTRLLFRFGLSWSADIPLSDIVEIKALTPSDKFDHFSHFVSPIGSQKNVLMTFNQPIKFTGRYGLYKKRSRAVVSVDDAKGFIKLLDNS